MSGVDDTTQVLVAIARIEGKVDQALAGMADHEERIRVVEMRPVPDTETEKRLKMLEDASKAAITLKQLWWGLGSVAGLLTAGFIIFDRLKVAIVGG